MGAAASIRSSTANRPPAILTPLVFIAPYPGKARAAALTQSTIRATLQSNPAAHRQAIMNTSGRHLNGSFEGGDPGRRPAPPMA